MQKFSYEHFRLCICRSDLRHIITAGFFIMHICHGVKVNGREQIHLLFVILSMAKAKRKRAGRVYLTKRRLISAARTGIRKAAEETMQIMGYTVIAENGWVVKKYADGRTEKISPIEVTTNGNLALD